ncbi:E3 ubiquitin-protein ligase TRIM71-like [Mytilus californianus]|uniref:E3 ubiquitin-protein ligase TRIM71-like n=1 Tax=Mytilus californianus TaxID=6549 RepID=UPI00224850E0|nr:E3 ubiquitin-protein ligase TRIM71-like [Mytilus californianus]
MASSVPICDICMTDNITKSASVWCSECEEAICNKCERQHGRMGLSKNHKPIPIKDYQKLPSSVAAIIQKCMRHNLKFDFYCVIHNEPCCVSCVSEEHGICQKLKPLSEVVEGAKSSAAFADLEDRAKDISALIGNLITEKQNNRASFGVQKNKIISEVQNIRAAINDHLIKLEKDLLDKLDNMEKKQIGNIDSFIKKLSEMRTKVENISGDLEKTKRHASNFQAFLGIHEWNKRIEIEEKDWMSLQTDQKMNHCDIYIKCSPTLMKFEKDVTELGKIEVNSSSSKKTLLKKEKQGQIYVPISNTVDNIKLTNIRSFYMADGTSNKTLITEICYC